MGIQCLGGGQVVPSIWRLLLPLLGAVAFITACSRPPSQSQDSQITNLSDGHHALLAALGSRRVSEARLTGFRAHEQCLEESTVEALLPKLVCSKMPSPGTASFARLAQAGREIQAEFARDDPPSAFRAKGIWHLAWARDPDALEQAQVALRRAAVASPNNAGVLNDYAVLLFAQAHQRDAPRYLVKALAQVDRTLQLNDRSVEALFNRALILERLLLPGQAREAWRAYLEQERDSAWREEGLHHLAAQAPISRANEWEEAKHELPRAALDGDIETVEPTRSADYPQAVRTYAEVELLPLWAESLSIGESEKAEQHLRVAEVLGSTLQRGSTRHILRDSIQAIRRAQAASDSQSQMLRLAQSHLAHAEGRRLHQSPGLRPSASPLSGGKSSTQGPR